MSLFGWFRRAQPAAPPRAYEFPAAAEVVAQRLEAGHSRAGGTGEALFPILPWRATAVPFFSIEMAMALADAGQPVRFVAHHPELPFHDHPHYASEKKILERLMAKCAERFPVDHAPDTGARQSLSEATLRLWTNENAVWLGKSESGAYDVEADPVAMEAMHREYDRIHGYLETLRPSLVFLPGGAMGATAGYVEACRRLEIPFATYDSGRGEIKLCMGGVAAHNDDVPEAFRFFSSRTDEEQETFRASAESWIVRRREGRDDYRLQLQDTEPVTRSNYLLLCLNYRADSAALLRQKLFPTVREWLAATVRWAVENNAQLVIRQHPCERLERFRGKDDWAAVIAAADPEGKAVQYISAFDPVNTYDLIENAAAVLPFTSRVGIECVMLGKPAIVSTHAFYGGLGFTNDPATVDEYFSLLGRAVSGGLRVTERQRQAAAVAYFTISEHTRIRTCFTPQPDDFLAWSVIPPRELWSRPEVKEMIEVLVSRRPFAVVRHETRPFREEAVKA